MVNKKIAKEYLARFLNKAGILSKIKGSRVKKKPIVLYYHRVSEHPNPLNYVTSLSIDVTQFEAQIRHLHENFNFISLYDVHKYYSKDTPLPDNSIAITFDDGFRDNYDVAFPILKKYSVPATVFLVTGFIGKSELLWWDKIFYQLDMIGRYNLRYKLYRKLNSETVIIFEEYYKRGDTGAIESIICFLKKRGYKFLMEIISHIDDYLAENNIAFDISREFLSWKEIREMDAHDITFGSHSVSHQIMKGVDEEILRYNIGFSKKELENQLCKQVDFFSYPNGIFDERAKKIVEKEGYLLGLQTSGLKTLRQHNSDKPDLFSLPRRSAKESHSKNIKGKFCKALFEAEILGAFDILFLRKLKKYKTYNG